MIANIHFYAPYRLTLTMHYPICVLSIVSLLSGCSNTPNIDQFETGEELYATYCASCHEIEGGIGPILSNKVLATRVNAQFLYNYNKANMPYEAGNTLSENQYWSITAYLLIREGFIDPSIQLSEVNADTLLLSLEN